MSRWPIAVIDQIAREERGVGVSRISDMPTPRCAVCKRDLCDHNDLEFAGLSPVVEG